MNAVASQVPRVAGMPRAVDPRGFKQGMRALAGAVAILATEDQEHGCCGLTATAICSLSAEPPCLLVCLNQKSSMAAIIRQGTPFSINLPAHDQEHVARAFGGMTIAKGVARFSAGSWVRGESGAPRLVGARAVFECLVDDVIARASHVIVIGLVLAVALDRESRDPLLYADGRFATVRTA
ncbi:flavin reductase family protein [Mesorhizobium sp. INR15]|uniref:flavin reductase family protein n=1 Tax=Mesorhizobium sp. INR15 TaxID=2654248 RepID=UPI0018967F84|nr:flavin reductase family protein [Mesorhizobium sp. INR15]QPC94721.1 flavin reductase [Mesorhizobium sp. INR15]